MSVTTTQATLSSWVGRSETTSDIASRAGALGLATLLNAPLDPDSVDTASLFPLGHWLQFNPPTTDDKPGPEGHSLLCDFVTRFGLPRRMWTGSDISFHSPSPWANT
ncbi:hypothetical protein G7067_12360 [Leucobacter insecticola]|uniref:Uncharacterized protein n=1 Tax=Leucobacter insecticola TaxID=2714934 RepID=A0A6G8FL58_9MICO|nr:hypothetical protein [Leucobacter insecticola]QIM17019.1 hypothetical protein G7067_12360 [Leucobacter insecticola]